MITNAYLRSTILLQNSHCDVQSVVKIGHVKNEFFMNAYDAKNGKDFLIIFLKIACTFAPAMHVICGLESFRKDHSDSQYLVEFSLFTSFCQFATLTFQTVRRPCRYIANSENCRTIVCRGY